MTPSFESDIGRSLPPGVYIQETTPRKINSFDTAVPLFLGFAEAIEEDLCEKVILGTYAAYKIVGFEQFESAFKVQHPDGVLDYAIRGFFENGGNYCYVVPITDTTRSTARLQLIVRLLHPPSPLEDMTGTDLICAPDIMMQSDSLLSCLRAQWHILRHCEVMENRFALLGGPSRFKENGQEGLYSENRAGELIHQLSNFPQRGRNIEGAMYFPWICVTPLARHRGRGQVSVPPCGHIAGIYTRSDTKYGVHKAPANELIAGAVDLTVHISDTEQAELNNAGVNCLRSIHGRGIRVWGARTLSTQPMWKYVHIRRLFITLQRWIEHNMTGLLYEPNNSVLWDRVCDKIGAYCFELFQRGALQGERPKQAFFVKCDAETNPLETRKNGQLICEIGLAPLAPSEFIIIRIAQSSAGTTATLLNS